MPVKLRSRREVDASWGMDVMVAPERQRQGIGEVLFRTWDRNVGASLGLGLSDASYRLFKKLRWPDVGPIPCLVKPLTPARASRGRTGPGAVNRLVSALTLPLVRIVARNAAAARRDPADPALRREFTALWERLAPKFDFAVRRDAAYLNWKYAEAPHVRYCIAALGATGNVGLRGLPARPGAARAGHAARRFPRRRRTRAGWRRCCTGSTARRAQADSDKMRTFAMHAGFRRAAAPSGYFQVKSTMEFMVKVNGVDVEPDFYEGHRPLARHARRFRPGSMSGAADAPARWNRHRGRQPVGRGGARNQRPSRTSTRCRGCTRGSRATACGRPTSITWPVATDPRSAEMLRLAAGRRRLRDRRAPPRVGDAAVHRRGHRPPSLRRNAAAGAVRAQLAALTAAIRPPSAGAPSRIGPGRFGFSADHVAPLERLGYLVESSVAPLFYEAHKGGPDFVEAPLAALFPRLRQRHDRRQQQRARGARCRRRSIAACRCRLAVALRAGAVAVHDEAGPPRAAPAAPAVAAPVLLVARRHDGAGAATSPRAGSRC